MRDEGAATRARRGVECSLSERRPSQWHACELEAPSGFESAADAPRRRFNCAEQYMMAEKALCFGDREALNAIMASSSPGAQKALGRGVRNFDEEVWQRVRYDVVVRGNLAKFSQNPALRRRLLESGERVIAEASASDRVWGIGLRADDPAATRPGAWRGENLLGKALMEVRRRLAGEARGGAAVEKELEEKERQGKRG